MIRLFLLDLHSLSRSICCKTWDLYGSPSYSRYIEDIYFFEVNTKYISSSVSKKSEFSRVRSTSEKFSDVFNSREEIYLVFTKKKSKFLFIIYFFGDLQLIE